MIHDLLKLHQLIFQKVAVLIPNFTGYLEADFDMILQKPGNLFIKVTHPSAVCKAACSHKS